MRQLWNISLKGLAALLPIGVTLYVIYWLATSAETMMGNLIQLVVAPEAIVYHEVSGSIGRTSASRRHYYLSSAGRFLRRHSPFPPLAIFVCWGVQMLIAMKGRSGVGRTV